MASARVADVHFVGESELERAVELARETPLERVLRFAAQTAHQQHVAHMQHVAAQQQASTGQVKSYVRAGHVVSGYQGQAGQAKPGPGQSRPTAAASLRVGSVIQVGGVAYRVLAVGRVAAAKKTGGVVAGTKGKKTTTNTAKTSAAAKAAAKAKSTSKSVSPQKALFGGASAPGQTQVMLQQVSTGAKFSVHMPPATSVPVVA